jgi:hypothetical protein
MSYNLIIVVLIVAMLMIPIVGSLIFFSYRQGIKDAKAMKEDKPLKPVVEKKAKKVEQDKEIKRMNTILENINNYNGSAVGQRDVSK